MSNVSWLLPLKFASRDASGARSAIATFFKREMDLIVSLSAIVAFAPFFAILIILLSLDGGPAFYAQTRVGRGGRIFRCWKFRTMVVDADEKLKQLLAADPRARQEYKAFWKLKDDPRVTKVGKLLRRYSLDELPQILNILKGDMSLVGPRPRSTKEMEFLESKTPELSQNYKMVRPGLTGLWQVSGRNSLSLETKAWLEAHYAKNWSIRGDIRIIFATFAVVLKGRGAY